MHKFLLEHAQLRPSSFCRRARPHPLVLSGGMLSFLKDEGCKRLLAISDHAWTCVAARSGAVRSVRLRQRVLDLCYSGISVSDQVSAVSAL